MGGYGSGRRERVINLSAFLRLDTFKLALPAPSGTAIAQQWTWADGSSISICANRDSLDLNFHEVDSQHKSIPVSQWMRLSWMPCHLGGMRFYVRCPHCHERARYLYCCGGLFICRKCTGRGYRSQNKNTDSRLCNGIAKLQRRLAGVEGDFYPDWVPWRPRGMRRHTYRRLVERLTKLQQTRDDIFDFKIAGFMQRWGLLPEDLFQ